MRLSAALPVCLAVMVGTVAFLPRPAMAQGDPRFCSAYGANMAGVVDLALKKNPACLDYGKGVHSNYQMHFDWCMKQPQASVQGAEANIRRLVTQCAASGGGSQPAGGSLNWIAFGATHWNPKTARVEPDPMKADDTQLSRWICRAPYRGGLVPGWHGIGNGCSIEFGGAQVDVPNFEVAVGRALWAWATSPGAIPDHAIPAGAEANGQPLYVCRALVRSDKLIGKVRPGFRGCNIGSDKAMTLPTYEVLVSGR